MVVMGAMSQLTDAQWQVFANLRPHLKPQVQLYCHRYRNRDWPVVEDTLKQSHFHVSPQAYAVLQQLNGQTQVHSLAAQWPNDNAQAELVQLLTGLYQADLLAGDFPVLAENLVARANRRNWQRWLNPLAQRAPLLNPNPWLKRHQPWADAILSPRGAWCWLALVVSALLVAASHAAELTQHWHSRFSDPGNLLWLPLVYVVMKLVHEWCHGAMIRRFGGDCCEAGIMLLVMMPLPYVNASAANSMPRQARMWVSAAGILAELGLAALAVIVWSMLAPGLLKDLCFNVLLVGFAASVLFNANPLMKFDGYYLLADGLQIPSLASRANQYASYLWQRYALGLASAYSPAELPGEKPWLLGYGVLAWLYRLLILVWIVGFLAESWWWLGLLVAAWAIVGQWLLPAGRGLVKHWRRAQQEQLQSRLIGVIGSAAVLLYSAVFVLPLPHSSYAQGMVRLPDNAVFSGAPGFIEQVMAEDGQWVEAGTPIIQLTNSTLQLTAQKLAAELAEHQQRYQGALVRQPAQAQAAAMAMELTRAQLADLNRQLNSLRLSAPRSGRLSLPSAQNLPGRWVEEGAVLAHVFDGDNLLAEVLVNQRDLANVQLELADVSVKTALQPGQRYQATLTNIAPQALKQLPNRLLGSAGGGAAAVDASDPEGLRTLQSWFATELLLPAEILAPVVPNRLHVRFRHSSIPVGIRAWQRLRQWWLDHTAMG